MEQLKLFEPEKVEPVFKHKSRGKIITSKIWKELDIHSKINIKVCYGYELIVGLCPNYWIITNAFTSGMDTYEFREKHDTGNNKGYLCDQMSNRNLRPN